MKTLNDQSTNKVTIIGKLLDATFNSGKTKAGAPYEKANITVRVAQHFGGHDEVSEIPVSMFASQFTQKGTPNPAYQSIQDLRKMKTAQDHGIDGADTVRITGAQIRENNFVAKSGKLINSWQINTSFVNSGNIAEVASFTLDIFIMDMTDELDREGDPTGRLIVKGAVVQYGEKLDVFNFIVENPDTVDYIRSNWNVNDTNTIVGRIRVRSIEEKSISSNSSWGEDIPDTTTRLVRELILTKGDDEGKEEDFAYDPAEIKKGFNVRKAEIEQLQLDAKNKSNSAAAATTTNTSKYNWE